MKPGKDSMKKRYIPLCTGKAPARIFLDRVTVKLPIQKRHAQFGFTHKKSSLEPILALRVLTERLFDLHTALLAGYLVSDQGVRLDEPRCALENSGSSWVASKARQSDM